MTNFTRCCTNGHPCPRKPQCSAFCCHFDTAELPIQMLPDPPEWQTSQPEINWTVPRWSIGLVFGAALVAWVVFL